MEVLPYGSNGRTSSRYGYCGAAREDVFFEKELFAQLRPRAVDLDADHQAQAPGLPQAGEGHLPDGAAEVLPLLPDLGEERLALFDNVTAGTLAYQLAAANLSCAYLSSEGLKGSVRDTLLAGSERYFLALLQDVDGKSFHLELKDTKEKRVWNRIYNLEVTLKDRKKAAIALIAADFLLSALTGKSALTPDNCEITVLSAGENYVA